MKRDITRAIVGVAPAVALVDPKYPSNVGKVLRNCAAFNIRQVRFSGDRLREELNQLRRWPREERMRSYGGVTICHDPRFYDAFDADVVPIGVELVPGAQVLSENFEHPEKALYVFGPEDGGLGKVDRMHCHQLIRIPTVQDRCLNLAIASGIILAHRYLQRMSRGLEDPYAPQMEPGDHRGFLETDEPLEWDLTATAIRV